jgi:hypothetical protein
VSAAAVSLELSKDLYSEIHVPDLVVVSDGSHLEINSHDLLTSNLLAPAQIKGIVEAAPLQL